MSTGGSSRLSYDVNEFQQRTTESVTPLEYQLYSGKFQRCNWCGIQNPNKKSELDFSVRVDIENDLLDINRKNSKASANKYQPPCNDAPYCELPNANFVPARICDRNVVWTNLEKPTNPGFDSNKINAYKC